MRAVIFDLWDTLVEWPVEEGNAIKGRIAAHVGGDAGAFEERWHASCLTAARPAMAEIGMGKRLSDA